MSFSWSNIPRPIVALAPMAGVTDSSYRQFIKKIAPDVMVYTEFLSTDAIHFGAKRTFKMLEFDPALERPFIVQIFGAEPEHFLTACKIIEQLGADGIDINMGCPAAKVVSSCHGSALIREPELAAELVASAKKVVNIPVSVKTRLGWETHETLIPFCQKLVEAGADALAIHGRTYHEKFTGSANWDPIYELKRSVSVPVLGNGDIASADDAVRKLKNLDGVMIGRGTFGNPWVMKDICDALHAKTQTPISTASSISFREKIPFILEHCELAVKIKGEQRGMLEMRRHLNSYVKGFDGAKELRIALMKTDKLDETKLLLQSAVC